MPQSNTPSIPSRPPLPIYIAWLIGFFAFINVYSIQAVLPLIQIEYEISKTATGLLVGTTLFAIALLSPFIGLISDRVGRKNIICTSLIALAIPTALIPLCDNLYLIMFLRFMQGIAVPGIIVVTMAYIGEEVPVLNVARTTAAYVSGSVMGGFAGRFVTGHIAELTQSWRSGFIFLAILISIGAILVIRFLPPSQNFIPSSNIRQGFSILKRHIKNPQLLAACAVGFCVLFSLASGFTYIGYLLQDKPFNLGTAAVANIFIVYLIGVVVTPYSSRLVNKFGNKKALIIALSLSMSGLLLTLSPTLIGVVCGITIFSSGMFICQAASIGFVATNVKQGRSLATGLYNLSYYCGGAIGTWLTGMANEYYHWLGTVTVIIFIQLMAAGIAYCFWGVSRDK